MLWSIVIIMRDVKIKIYASDVVLHDKRAKTEMYLDATPKLVE